MKTVNLKKIVLSFISSILNPLLTKDTFVILTNSNIESLCTASYSASIMDDNYLQQTVIRISSHIISKSLHDHLPKYSDHYVNLKNQLNKYEGPETNSIVWAREILNKYENKYELS